MLPVIGHIGPFPIYSYGLMLAVAVVVCSFLLRRDAARQGIGSDTVYDLVLWTVAAGILGARIFYIILNLDFFIVHPQEVVMLQRGGLAWQGGLVLGSWAGWRFMKKRGLPLWPTLDLLAPYAALGQGIGRIGCFLTGCCYGREAAWGPYFPVHGAHLHPTQLYATAALVTIFFILKRARRFLAGAGQLFALYLILASLQRFVIEFFRADHVVLPVGISIFQCVTIVVASVGVGLFISRGRAKGSTP